VSVSKTKPKSKARLAFDLGDATWVKCAKAPSEKELAKKPVGAIFFYRGDEKTSVYVKVEERTGANARSWRRAYRRSLGSALAQIEEIDERNAKRPDDYDVASSLKGVKGLMTGTIGVALRMPIARIDVKTLVLAGGAWGPLRVSDVSPASDDLGKAYRAKITTKHGRRSRRAHDAPSRRREVPTLQPHARQRIRESIELNLKSAGELATSTITVTR
jgi:hypothetical protein